MISFIMSLVLLGGFYDWSVSITGICILIEILVLYCRKKPIYKKKKDYFMWIPAIVFLWMIAVTFWSLDYSENLLGILRGGVILFWMYLCFQMEENEKQKIFTIIPYLGAIMVGIGIVSLLNENLAANFWQARRFGGFFQYANTCALFLMIGIILQGKKIGQEKTLNCRKNILSLAVLVTLLVGLFLTGSRSILLLFLAWGIYKAIRIKRLRVPFFIIATVCLIAVYVYGVIAKDNQNIARIFTIFQANSTIYGRILYDIDALSIVKDHPFGLGYMGYYYIQPAVQTGVYTTRFVHNDVLQVMVDYGIPALLLMLTYLGYQLLKGKQSAQQKELIVLLVLASLMDFHLQYMSLLMLLVLCFDLGEKECVKKRRELRENYFFFGISIVIGVYFTVAFGAHYFGNSKMALMLFNDYTGAQIQSLNECADKEEAVKLADEILSHNAYVSEAYHTKVYASVMDGDFLQASEFIDKSLSIRRYDVESYQQYDILLEKMIELCENIDILHEKEILTEKKAELPQRLAALEEETHPIAFKLRDVPQFMW